MSYRSDQKVAEEHIKIKYSKCNSFHVTTALLKNENLRIAIAPLCNELQVCNFTMV